MTERRDPEFERPAPDATRLSRLPLLIARNRRLLRLAWEPLLWFSIMTLVASCIVADPPQYTNPSQTRPELSAYSATPAVYQVLVIQSSLSSRPTFHVPVRSEDAGEKLIATLWRDYKSANPKFINGLKVPPSAYNDTSDRFIELSWTGLNSSDDKGCHTVSMVVAHDSSFPTNQLELDPMLGEKDAAIVTWWVNVDPPAGALYTLVGCPGPQGS